MRKESSKVLTEYKFRPLYFRIDCIVYDFHVGDRNRGNMGPGYFLMGRL